MNKKKLETITEDLKTFFRNEVLDCFERDNIGTVEELLDIIASLHNELYKQITGEYYDYMFHWSNKGGYDGLIDNLYKEDKKE